MQPISFEPDGCTLWFDGLMGRDWRHCCDAHDLAYADLADKIVSDLELALCVAQAGAPVMGLVMLAGVTVFGWVWYARARRRHSHWD